MLVIRPREAWQLAAQPVTGPVYDKAGIVDVVYHYPGSGLTTSYADPVRSLRAMQADYLRNRGYSLGYNYAIDPTGVAWTIRGLEFRCAATAGFNDKGVAVQFMVPGQQPANAAQMGAAVELHRVLEALHRRRLGVAGHCQRGTTATPCPGSGILAQLPTLDRLIHTPTPVPDWEDDEMPKPLLVRHVDGRMFCTDRATYAHYCTEDEGAHLRDNLGAVVGPDRGPWPLTALESEYVARMAGD